MADEDTRYDYKAEIVRRGTEAPVFAQMQTEGWEFVREKPGLFKTQLMFRRPRPTSAGGNLALALTVLRTRPEAKAALGLVGIAVVCLTIALVAPESDGRPSEAFGGGGAAGPAVAASEAAPAVEQTVQPVLADSDAEPESDLVLTRKNNKDLARLLALTNTADESIGRFAEQYEGRTIAFKGNVSYVSNFDDYSRHDCDVDVVLGCDFLINTGDYDPNSSTGPNIKFEDVDSVDGLHLTGSKKTVGTGDDVRVVAVVDHWDSTKEHLYLTPVSTTFR